MTIPTQDVLIAGAAAFRQADFHIKHCETCQPDMRLPELCTVGQRMTLDAATAMTPATTSSIDPLPPTVASEFEANLREQVHAELVYYADRMEAHQPDRADVRRDAHEVRQAARVARDGLGARLFTGCLAEEPTRYMDEIGRLRAAVDEEMLLRVIAEEWADTLAYRIAPPEVIGHQSTPGATPWDDAAELVTPAAEVAALRAQIIALQTGQEPPADCCDSWTPDRADQIRALVVRLANGDDNGNATPMTKPVETAAAIEAATALQMRCGFLEWQAADLRARAERAATPPRTHADGGVNDLRELYDVQHAITAAGATLTTEIHRTVDALRSVSDRALAAEQAKLRDLERENAMADPERMAILRPEFIAGASVEAIQLKIKRARMNGTRWTNRIAKLEALLEERLAQIKAGAWPASDADGYSVRKCPNPGCGCGSAQPAKPAALPQRTSRLHPNHPVGQAVQPDAPTS